MFVIQTMPRCGTHMLRTSLNSHGGVWCYHELFNPATQSSGPPNMTPPHIRDVSAVIQHCQSQKRETGFVVHAYVGLADDETGPALGPEFRRRADVAAATGLWRAIPPGSPVVTLQRDNLLARYVSHRVAQRTRRWQVYRGDAVPPPPTIQIDCQDMLLDFEQCESLRKIARRRFPDALCVSYEQLTTEMDAVLTAIQSHIRVPVKSLTPGTLKLGRPLAETILNLDEVALALRGSRFESFLEAMT